VSTHSTRLTQYIAAPRAVVYRALLDPVAVAIWMVPDGMTSHIHEFDAREGGGFRITLSYDRPTGTGKSTPQSDTYHGRFRELVPDERVVQVIEFETEDPTMQGEMYVTYTLTEADGGTLLYAAHDRLPAGLSPEDNELGWRISLQKLGRLLARG
jgi:uncharacterized protein YndB with AHSA1/START domain